MNDETNLGMPDEPIFDDAVVRLYAQKLMDDTATGLPLPQMDLYQTMALKALDQHINLDEKSFNEEAFIKACETIRDTLLSKSQ